MQTADDELREDELPQGRSGSTVNPTYWWYLARSRMLRVVLEAHVPENGRILDIGSADGPSVGWLGGRSISIDVDFGALRPGGVCGSATALPFTDGCARLLTAFDVIEHLEDDRAGLREFHRVLADGGALFLSVPAYAWAWSEHDVRSGHHRRYTRRQVVRLLEQEGFEVHRATYAFAGTFPLFAFDRVTSRFARRAPEAVASGSTPGWMNRLLLALCRLDAWLLRVINLPFGSSVFIRAQRR